MEVEDWLGAIPEVVRVLPVAIEVPNHAGGRSIVASVEVWNDHLVVRSAVVAGDGEHGTAPCAIVDDVGTDYRVVATSAVDDDRTCWLTAVAKPAPPRTASKLSIGLDGAVLPVTVRLRRIGFEPPRATP